MSTAVPALRTDPPAAGVVLPGPRRPSEPADEAAAAVPAATPAPSPAPTPAPAPRAASNAPMVLLTAALVVALGLAVHLGMTADAWHDRADAAAARQAHATATTTALEQRVDVLQDDLDSSDARIEQLAAEKARAADLAAATAQRSGGSARSAAATAAPAATTVATSAPAVGQGDALRTAGRASVRLRSVGCTGVETGSGFAVDAHTLVTNAHVVTGAQRLQVDTWDGHELVVTGTVVAVGADLAVVRTREELPTSLRLADADPAAGEAVTVVGYPRGEALARAGGTVVGPVADPLGASTGRVLAVDAQVAPGSSGSAVVDAAGAVVGVVYAGATTGEHAYAVPVSALRAALSAAPSSSSEPSGGC